jgi:hypothetical protein
VLARRDGNATQALNLSKESVEHARRSNGPAFLGDCLSGCAEVLKLLGRTDEARPLLEEAAVDLRAKRHHPRRRARPGDAVGNDFLERVDQIDTHCAAA